MKSNEFSGFTLLELLITIAIIGILASIAYPSYQNSVLKTRRTDGKSALLAAAGKQESYFSSSNSYSSTITDLGGNTSSDGYYTLAVTNPSCATSVNGVTIYSCFTLTATATGGQTSDTGCTTLTLNHAGVKTPVDGCW